MKDSLDLKSLNLNQIFEFVITCVPFTGDLKLITFNNFFRVAIVFKRCMGTFEVNIHVFKTCTMAYIAKTQKSLVLILFCPHSLEISWLGLVVVVISNLSLHFVMDDCYALAKREMFDDQTSLNIVW